MSLRTERLELRRLDERDAPFILELVNDPDWLKYIGDRGVRNLEDARRYIVDGPVSMYERRGYGLYGVALAETGMLIGLCGLIKRDALEDTDIGFAFMPAHRGAGYAFEAAAETLRHARCDLGLPRVVAIVTPGNTASISLLERLGLYREKLMRMPNEEADVALYTTGDFTGDFPQPPREPALSV